MLVLSRAAGQNVVLDDRIVVTVLVSRPGIVRLGIDAPDGVTVRRGELDPPAPPEGAPVLAPGGPIDPLGAGTRASDG
jgi:carbon storage regulator CsrA